jgi:hypothetical protein
MEQRTGTKQQVRQHEQMCTLSLLRIGDTQDLHGQAATKGDNRRYICQCGPQPSCYVPLLCLHCKSIHTLCIADPADMQSALSDMFPAGWFCYLLCDRASSAVSSAAAAAAPESSWRITNRTCKGAARCRAGGLFPHISASGGNDV